MCVCVYPPVVPAQSTGLVDFDQLAERAGLFKPAMIICGGSAYPRDWDYRKYVSTRARVFACGLMCVPAVCV